MVLRSKRLLHLPTRTSQHRQAGAHPGCESHDLAWLVPVVREGFGTGDQIT